jgi:hypothetical protein
MSAVNLLRQRGKEAMPIEVKTRLAMPPLVEILPLRIEGCNKSFAFGQTYSKRLLHASDAAFIQLA